MEGVVDPAKHNTVKAAENARVSITARRVGLAVLGLIAGGLVPGWLDVV